MTAAKPADATRPNHSTGPKSPAGKRVCRLNAYRHGLTSHLRLQAPDEQHAYETHSKIILEYLAPVGDLERDLAQSISDDRWRLTRARAIETSTFALGMREHRVDETGNPQIDDALAQARTWAAQAHNLHLLTIYEQRIRRSADKNMAQLEAMQAERKRVAKEAMRQAMLLLQLAQAEGKPYEPKAFFDAAAELRESVFSTTEVARELSRAKLLSDAENYHRFGRLPQKDEPKQFSVARASAGESTSEPKTVSEPPPNLEFYSQRQVIS